MGDYSSALNNRYKGKRSIIAWLKSNQSSLKAWGAFCFTAFLLFHFFSDKSFSFLLTLSSLIAMFSFIMVIYKMETAESVQGVSLKMFECYIILIFARLCAIIPFQGYVPFDKSGDWLYQLIEGITFCLTGSILYMGRTRFKSTYDSEYDTFNHFYLIGFSLILSLVLHPHLNSYTPTDISWAFATYLESVCVFPQLFMFQKLKQVEPFTTHFLAGQAISKVFSFLFWLSTHQELNDPDHLIHSYNGIWLMIMQLIQLILMGDFIFHYVRCISQGLPMEMMMSEVV